MIFIILVFFFNVDKIILLSIINLFQTVLTAYYI